jgi:probable F420-dependent oxidoreductase
MDRNYWAALFYAGDSDFLSAVRKFEESGLAGVAIPQVYGPPFVPLAAAATVSKRMLLATGIAIGLTRSPFETAMAALDLDHLSHGRFILGLGTGPTHFTKGYYGMPYDKPVSRLREVVQILRQVEDGARTGRMKPWRGDCYQLEFHGYEPTSAPYRERIPVWIAALRQRMCELAGEVADGLIGHPIWSVEWALGQAQRSLASGAARTGRDPAKIHFQPWVTVSIDRDTKKAVSEAKPSVAFYAGFAQYHSYFEAHGFASEARRLQEASKTISCAEAANLVPDEMARTFAACGTPDQVREYVEPLWKRANSMMLNTPSWGLSPERQAAHAAAIAETFWNIR